MNEQIRTWGIRLLALGIAIGLWLNASLEDRLESTERLIEASVSYNRPRGFIIMNQISTVNVSLRGNKRAVRQLTPYAVDVQVELPQREPGVYTINLRPENVLRPEGLDVVSIEPNVVRVELEREVTQRLPVVPKLIGKPEGLMDEPEVFPNQVLVAGPEPLVTRIGSLTTRPIDLTGQILPFEITVPVDPPDPLIQVVQPSQVTVRIPPLPPPDPETPADQNGARPAREQEPP
ncbi:MAG TPA: CdaR family protein [Thermoanaerobaculia bacterium]|nr:CdaR family protein [Thermoanaerobaculia bacterium]